MDTMLTQTLHRVISVSERLS